MKRKGHLAVFENILEESNAENELDEDSVDMVIDEDFDKPKVRKKMKKLTHELNLFTCRYEGCTENFEEYYKFDKHLVQHVKYNSDARKGSTNSITCKYGECEFRPINTLHAIQHISIHGYHDKLMSLGEIVIARDSLPDCTMENAFSFPVNVETYLCKWEDCRTQMETFCDFVYHMKMHVNGNPRRAKTEKIKCCWQGCQRSFNLLYKLSKHMPTHTKEKYIACPSCGNVFPSLIRFSDHRRKQIPAEKKNYKCSKCFKLFATENLLRDHVRGHINQYKCSMCDMTCPKPSALAIHIRYRHLKDRPFKCNLCDHASISKQNLEMHLITHCAEKLLACNECDFQCRSMFGLDKHIQKEHGLNYSATFECHFCKDQFTRGAYLTKHLMKNHGVQWPSGHSRFRYKQDPDGICRLQTMRYETVDVIREIINGKTVSPSSPPIKLKCRILEKEDANGEVRIEAKIEEVKDSSTNDIKTVTNGPGNVLLTISDLDDRGNVVSEVVESQKVLIKQELDDEKLINVS